MTKNLSRNLLRCILLIAAILPAHGIISSLLDNVFVDIIVGIGQALTCWNFYPLSGYPRRDDYDDVLFAAEDLLTNMPACSAADCPALTMQGVFWLSYAVEVMTFAPTREGGDLGLPLGGDPPRQKLRLLSERNWAVTQQGTELTRALFSGPLDFAVEFVLREGTVTAPEVFDLFLDYRFPLTCSRVSTQGCGPLYPEWTMTLQNVPGTNTEHDIYSNSVVWLRDSATILGTSSNYEAIQIADADGNPLEPAFSAFLLRAPNSGAMLTKTLRASPEPPLCAKPWCVLGIFC